MGQAELSNGALDEARGEYLGWTGNPVATLKAAIAADPGFILGHTMLAALHRLGGFSSGAKPIQRAFAAANVPATAASETLTDILRKFVANSSKWLPKPPMVILSGDDRRTIIGYFRTQDGRNLEVILAESGFCIDGLTRR